MDANKILKKVEEANKKEDFMVFKLEHNGKILHDIKIVIPEYAVEAIEGERFYYFFKDMSNLLEDKIVAAHKEFIWKQMNNKKDGE